MKERYRLLCKTENSIPVFSRDWWLDIVCGKDKWEVLLVEEKERIPAVMPLYLPVPNLVSMPAYTQTMGPWFAVEAEDTKYTTALGKRQIICKAFTEELKKHSSFLQNFSYHITDWLPFYWEGYKQTTRYTYLLKNIRKHELLLSNMSVNIRRNLTKAKDKEGIVVQKGIPVADFMRIHAQTFARQKKEVTSTSAETLRRLIVACRERKQGDIWGGYDREGKLHAAAFIVWQESSAYYLAGGGDPAVRDSGAHSLVLWEAIRYVSQYTDLFDFEGSMLPGVERFFREFGGIQTPFFTISKGKPGLLDKARIRLSKHKAGKEHHG
jgi:hypothetical protein